MATQISEHTTTDHRESDNDELPVWGYEIPMAGVKIYSMKRRPGRKPAASDTADERGGDLARRLSSQRN